MSRVYYGRPRVNFFSPPFSVKTPLLAHRRGRPKTAHAKRFIRPDFACVPIPQEARHTIETIYCATLWICRCYDKREPMYIEERLKFAFNRTLFRKYTLIKDNLFDSRRLTRSQPEP